jgi:hypothetical protein
VQTYLAPILPGFEPRNLVLQASGCSRTINSSAQFEAFEDGFPQAPAVPFQARRPRLRVKIAHEGILCARMVATALHGRPL